MAAMEIKTRHPGIRWCIVGDRSDPVIAFAVDELQRSIQHRVPYTLEVRAQISDAECASRHLFLVGTATDDPRLKRLIARRQLVEPRSEEGYSLACLASPWNAEHKLVVVAGTDPRGALYGAVDLIANELGLELPSLGSDRMRTELDLLAPFARQDAPLLANRGVWTWGYVMYDYRRFFDNMARLRMNMVTIWNDCVPLNCAEVIDFAHRRGIRVILGFAWGWGHRDIDLAKPSDRAALKRQVLEEYRENYHHLELDGIYFQTLTEHDNTRIGGRSLASLVCVLVNEISRALLRLDPRLVIQFGLHASSIQDDHGDLAALDPRVTIVWENAGGLPYSYIPDAHIRTPHPAQKRMIERLPTPEKTLAYSRKLAAIRPGSEFALVPKGWLQLRWAEDFEHHGPFLLGERDHEYIRSRLAERQPRWDALNAKWLRSYPQAARFYRAMLDCRPERLTVTGLIEDGMLEEKIQSSVAIFAQTLWNPRRPDSELLHQASTPYYQRGW